MSEPKRIQLSRRKGWRMPENTVTVARPLPVSSSSGRGLRDGLRGFLGNQMTTFRTTFKYRTP